MTVLLEMGGIGITLGFSSPLFFDELIFCNSFEVCTSLCFVCLCARGTYEEASERTRCPSVGFSFSLCVELFVVMFATTIVIHLIYYTVIEQSSEKTLSVVPFSL